MSSQIITPAQAKSLREMINRASRIAVTCHMTPDGDAMGSSLCLAHVLSAMGKAVTVVVPDCPPQNLSARSRTDSRGFVPSGESPVCFPQFGSDFCA